MPTGSKVKITARGPVGSGHWVGFAPKGSPITAYLKYGRPTAAVTEMELMPPSEPGEYELRYVLNESEKIIATHPIKVTPAVAKLDTPASVATRQEISVRFGGPHHKRHWIGFVKRDTMDYLNYAYVPLQGDSVSIRAPDEAGDYDIVFVMGDSAIARNPVTVR